MPTSTSISPSVDFAQNFCCGSDSLSAAKRICDHVRPVDQDPAAGNSDLGLIADFEDQQQCLESTARLFWVLNKLGSPSPFERECAGLLRAVLAAQAQDGHFEMGFVKRDEKAPEDVRGAAWAMLAIGANGVSDGKTLTVLTKGQSYYQDWYTRKGLVSFQPGIALLVRAFAQTYVTTNDARVSDVCFQVLDRWAAFQLDRRSCPRPELWGAINAAQPGVVGVDTACYVAALADGFDLARRIGDQTRAENYHNAIRKAVRFIVQLQFTHDGCFYARFPQDVLGAIRAAPWDHRIRIDYCSDALIALIRAHDVLYKNQSKP